MSPLVAANLAALRERKGQLRAEIAQLLQLGAQVVERTHVVGKDRSGKEIRKTRTQPRGLTNDERQRVIDLQREISDIDATFRAFAE